jgi:hypothetical protein
MTVPLPLPLNLARSIPGPQCPCSAETPQMEGLVCLCPADCLPRDPACPHSLPQSGFFGTSLSPPKPLYSELKEVISEIQGPWGKQGGPWPALGKVEGPSLGDDPPGAQGSLGLEPELRCSGGYCPGFKGDFPGRPVSKEADGGRAGAGETLRFLSLSGRSAGHALCADDAVPGW